MLTTEQLVLGSLKKETSQCIGDFLNMKIDEHLNSKSNPQVVQQASAADELMKWKGLLDSGIITEDEFNKKKSELI